MQQGEVEDVRVLRELRQEPDIVLIEIANVGNTVAAHANAFDAQSEGEAGDFVGIVTDRTQYIRVDHAGPTHFEPARMPAHIDFHAWLGEGEERRAETNVDVVAPEVTLAEES